MYHPILFLSVTPPPILHDVLDQMLRSFVDQPLEAKKLMQYINHTQPVKRGIKDLSFVTRRHPVKDRDAVLKFIVANRQKIKSFRTVSDYTFFEAEIPEKLTMSKCKQKRTRKQTLPKIHSFRMLNSRVQWIKLCHLHQIQLSHQTHQNIFIYELSFSVHRPALIGTYL